MISVSESYKRAVVGVSRRTHLRVPLRVISPDLVYGTVTGAGAASSHPDQVHDGVTAAGARFDSLETNYWLLDGGTGVWADDYATAEQVGFISDAMSDEDGDISVTLSLGLSGVTVLQAVTVAFSGLFTDGVAVDFSISVNASGNALASQSYTGNTAALVEFTGFTAYNPDEIALTITKWSLPNRRARVLELYPGIARDWNESDIVSLSLRMQANVATTAQPYGTATVTIDNSERLFDPREKGSLFLSMEERLNIPFFIGVELEDGSTEWVPAGVYYIHNNGWSSSNSWLGMQWKLVDIIGLLSGRSFIAPTTLPTTLEGWVAALVAQLGTAFVSRYTVDADYAAVSLTATADDVDGKSCTELLRMVCQASGTFARMDAETGYLAVEPVWNSGNEYTLDNLSSLPTLLANNNIGSIIFKLGDSETVIGGTSEVSANTLTVNNPFITTENEAAEAAKHILTAYGGNKISTTGRGDPSSEVGDVATVELMGSDATVGRITMQSFEFSGGVLQNCKTEYLQADGIFNYENRETVTEDGTWTVPTGVTEIKVVLIGGGQGGGRGQSGTMPGSSTAKEGWVNGETGAAGTNGTGGKVYSATIAVTPGQTFAVVIGTGGTAGSGSSTVDGGNTTFGNYSSASGRVYTPSYTDLASGNAYGRTGVKAPIANRGDGGRGGDGGAPGAVKWAKLYDIHGNWTGAYERVSTRSPGSGSVGSAGSSGCVLIYYDRE